MMKQMIKKGCLVIHLPYWGTTYYGACAVCHSKMAVNFIMF